MFILGNKYTAETKEDSYKTYMKLTIHNLTDEDFKSYRCIAKNSLGETDGSIKLYGEYIVYSIHITLVFKLYKT